MNQEKNLTRKLKQYQNSETLNYDICDFCTTSRKGLNIHMIKDHKDLEQWDENISISLTYVEEAQKDTLTETDHLETEADFTIKFKYGKTIGEVDRKLEKLWYLNIYLGFKEPCVPHFLCLASHHLFLGTPSTPPEDQCY